MGSLCTDGCAGLWSWGGMTERGSEAKWLSLTAALRLPPLMALRWMEKGVLGVWKLLLALEECSMLTLELCGEMGEGVGLVLLLKAGDFIGFWLAVLLSWGL